MSSYQCRLRRDQRVNRHKVYRRCKESDLALATEDFTLKRGIRPVAAQRY